MSVGGPKRVPWNIMKLRSKGAFVLSIPPPSPQKKNVFLQALTIGFFTLKRERERLNPCLLRRAIPIFLPVKPIPITYFINILLPIIKFGGLIRGSLERVNIFAIDFSIRWMVSRISAFDNLFWNSLIRLSSSYYFKKKYHMFLQGYARANDKVEP